MRNRIEYKGQRTTSGGGHSRVYLITGAEHRVQDAFRRLAIRGFLPRLDPAMFKKKRVLLSKRTADGAMLASFSFKINGDYQQECILQFIKYKCQR